MTLQESGWLAGAAIHRFVVKPGTPMDGYAARTGPSTGTFDELEVGALILAHRGKRLVIVTADVVAIDAGIVDSLVARVGIDRSELLVCASHTHSGPAGIVPNLHPSAPDRTDPTLRESFLATCAAVIEKARERLEPVELLFGSSDTTGLAANRNVATGPFDPRVSVLATRTASRQLSAVLVHFACHPTILGAENRHISADFPGALRRRLGTSLERRGQMPAILFANGAAGDVSTRYTRRGQDSGEVERVGTGLAAAAATALTNARNVSGPIRYGRKTVAIEPRALDEGDGSTPGAVNDANQHPAGPEQRRIETRAQGAALLRELMARGPQEIPSTVDVEAWALGDLALIAVPGELFSLLGSEIAGGSDAPTIVLGYANGYVGYLADEAAHAASTYEALASPFAPGAGERVASAAIELCESMRVSGPRGPGIIRSGARK